METLKTIYQSMMKCKLPLLLFSLLLGTRHLQAQNTGINTKVSNSTLTVNGSYAGGYRIINADASLGAADQYINVTAAAAITLTLPDAVVANAATDAFYGRVYHITNTSAFDVTIKAAASQLIQTGPGAASNTVIIKSGQYAGLVKNNNNTAGQPLWDAFAQTSADNGSSFPVGTAKSIRVVIPAASFTNATAPLNVMAGKRAVDVGVTSSNSSSAYELAGDQQANFIVINGLRMDVIKYGATTFVRPKLFNTTNANVTYTVASLSTYNHYIEGAYTIIPPNYFSYFIGGGSVGVATPNESDVMYANKNDAGYVNAMITFPDGQWYNCTWHGLQVGTNYYFYFTARRLN